jgi:hypothetical protein
VRTGQSGYEKRCMFEDMGYEKRCMFESMGYERHCMFASMGYEKHCMFVPSGYETVRTWLIACCTAVSTAEWLCTGVVRRLCAVCVPAALYVLIMPVVRCACSESRTIRYAKGS